MKKHIIYTLLLLCCNMAFTQITGHVSNKNGAALPLVNVLIANTYQATSTNEQGNYQLNVTKAGNYELVFRYLGFKTQKVPVTINSFPFNLNIVLEEETFALETVVINRKANPALEIIKKAIASKKLNSEKTARYKADFYSRGMMKIKNLPKKIMGMKVDVGDDMNANLDSTGSGILYLSETVSKLVFEKPNHFKENIIASKISGNNNGFSYNTALSSRYDFYDNNLSFGTKMISPIADNALGYYKYKLVGSFFDENKNEINKIQVIPKRDGEPVFEGYIYIVENSWAIYAVDLDIKGYRMKNEFIEKMTLKQDFSFNNENKIWAKNTQSLDFSAGGFGVKFNAKFNYVFSNYEFYNHFDKNTFSSELISIDKFANKKDSLFWKTARPIPLTTEEKNDYQKKDSLYLIRTSKPYLDSIDKKNNRFKFFDIIKGYTYKNSFKKWSITYEGFNLFAIQFNTVQGFNIKKELSFYKYNDETGKSTSIKAMAHCGFSDKRLYPSLLFSHQFNHQNYAKITISVGKKINPFNEDDVLLPILNTGNSLFFKRNYLKLYAADFIKLQYNQNVANGINFDSQLEYQKREPLFNTTDYAFANKDNVYTSNNPLAPSDFVNAGFDTHNLLKAKLNFKINFGGTYISRPDGKINFKNSKYPTLILGYEKGLLANKKEYQFDLFKLQMQYNLSFQNKGVLSTNTKAGSFLNAKNIAFMDYQHFNGNQTNTSLFSKYLSQFNLMPYYQNSTNDAFFEFHSEYDDQGFMMNKIPLLNKLKSNLVLGFHSLSIPNKNPYIETTIGLKRLGFGKFKIFRIDYIQSFQKSKKDNGIIFGISFFD